MTWNPFLQELSKDEAPAFFMYVFLSTTAAIMSIYFFCLLIYHCVFWPKILAKIKADKPKQKAKEQQMLRELAVSRERDLEDKTQSERTETPGIERTQSVDDIFRTAQTVVSENASLAGDKTGRSARSLTDTHTMTAAPAASPQLGLETAKEARAPKGAAAPKPSAPKPKHWFEDDMMTTGMEVLEPPPPPQRTSESKDHRKGRGKGAEKKHRGSDPEHIRTGREDFLRTGRERKDGGRTARRIRFASPHDDTRTCLEKLPLMSHSSEERKSDDAAQWKKGSEDLRKRRKGGFGGAGPTKEAPPRSVYAFEVDSKSKESKDKDKAKQARTVATAKSTDNSRDRSQDRLLDLCKTQED